MVNSGLQQPPIVIPPDEFFDVTGMGKVFVGVRHERLSLSYEFAGQRVRRSLPSRVSVKDKSVSCCPLINSATALHLSVTFAEVSCDAWRSNRRLLFQPTSAGSMLFS
jgi:hypothetical protein